MFVITYFVPESHLEITKNALFEKGAGTYRSYDQCAWQTLGTGQFRPLDGARPYLGQIGTLEKVEEYRVEMICSESALHNVLHALILSHPYEQPAYFVTRTYELKEIVKCSC